MAKKYFFTIAFVSWMVFVTFSSLYSFEENQFSRFNIPHKDKIVHFIFYFVACFLGLFFLRERTKGKILLSKAIVIMLVATIIFGILMEIFQFYFTTERTGDIFDVLANSTGSFGGAIATKFFFSGKRQLKWKF